MPLEYLPKTAPRIALSLSRIEDEEARRAIENLTREIQNLQVMVARIVNNNATELQDYIDAHP